MTNSFIAAGNELAKRNPLLVEAAAIVLSAVPFLACNRPGLAVTSALASASFMAYERLKDRFDAMAPSGPTG